MTGGNLASLCGRTATTPLPQRRQSEPARQRPRNDPLIGTGGDLNTLLGGLGSDLLLLGGDARFPLRADGDDTPLIATAGVRQLAVRR